MNKSKKAIIGTILIGLLFIIGASLVVKAVQWNGKSTYEWTWTIDSSVASTYSQRINWSDIEGNTVYAHIHYTSTSTTHYNDSLLVILVGYDNNTNLWQRMDTLTITDTTNTETAITQSSHYPMLQFQIYSTHGANKNAKNGILQIDLYGTVNNNTKQWWLK